MYVRMHMHIHLIIYMYMPCTAPGRETEDHRLRARFYTTQDISEIISETISETISEIISEIISETVIIRISEVIYRKPQQ